MFKSSSTALMILTIRKPMSIEVSINQILYWRKRYKINWLIITKAKFGVVYLTMKVGKKTQAHTLSCTAPCWPMRWLISLSTVQLRPHPYLVSMQNPQSKIFWNVPKKPADNSAWDTGLVLVGLCSLWQLFQVFFHSIQFYNLEIIGFPLI